MAALGGPACFHGAFQEVRYWAASRSKTEIRKTLHTLLPESATTEGLIGWWTFEEGGGRFVADVTEGRYGNAIHCRGVKWVESELLGNPRGQPPPTPAWRERAVCQVELKRVRLATRGRRLLDF